ncbi:MAG: hemerythrin family protein [Phascolarctobacterium sp.]|nr:hemerythrin family protein [Phascolarctobacterium sp.]
MEARFTPSLITGNEKIDNQHKELIKRANDLFKAIEGGGSKDKIQETLNFLAEYTTYHFADEEKLWTKGQIPTLLNHKKEHADLIEVVKGLQAKLATEGPSPEFEKQVYDSVVDWLYTHIKGSDHDACEYVNIRYQQDSML